MAGMGYTFISPPVRYECKLTTTQWFARNLGYRMPGRGKVEDLEDQNHFLERLLYAGVGIDGADKNGYVKRSCLHPMLTTRE